MRTQYIAITFTNYGTADNPHDALIKALGEDKDLRKAKTFSGVRLIRVLYPDGETDADDIIYYQTGKYELKGRTAGCHYDDGEILNFLELDYDGI